MSQPTNTRKASFNVIIIGAGLGGLGAALCLAKKGHRVTVLEAATQLTEIGAGIQIPPNSSRVLHAYGLASQFEKKVVWPKSLTFYRYATGEEIGSTPLHPFMTDAYGYPYWLIHRADYQVLLYEAAKQAGATMVLGAVVDHVDERAPAVTLQGGRRLEADLIVGADGIRSKTRRAVIPDEKVEARDSPNCAYRITVPASLMHADDTVKHLMTDADGKLWIGPDRHIMAYPIRQGAMYNVVLSHPGKASVGRWNEPGNLEEMKTHYATWDPAIGNVLSKVSGCMKWKLADLPPLSNWVSRSGRVVLIGDAAHAMLPYLAQGAAMGIEDGAALGECLDRATTARDIRKVLQAFQTIRKSRCERVQLGSRDNGQIWHLPDGKEQEQRDKGMRQMGTQQDEPNPNQWNDEDFQPWLFGHDVFSYTNDMLDVILKPRAHI